MRIIGGEARGRRLYAPPGMNTRPTADRVRESLFNILARRVPGARVLDLFAGSGAMALEALSRGAAEAVLVDSGREAASAIERNAAAVLGAEASARAKLLRMDYRAALAKLSGPFDIVFIDPPYRMEEAYALAAEGLLARGLLAGDAVVAMEMTAGAAVALPEGLKLMDERGYGNTVVVLARKEKG